MPVGDSDELRVTGLDPALIDRSGDPGRTKPEFHETGAPAYQFSEGKAGLQDTYVSDSDSTADFPTDEELKTLRRVPASIPWRIYTIAFVELVERMSYYGTVAVYSNFISKPRPTATGAALHPDDAEAVPGALGMGKAGCFLAHHLQRFLGSTSAPSSEPGLPDTYLGRFKTILYSGHCC
ncbi:hypothetical protein SNOG_06398 [Parastagonospora nodorum SN15]|uniref:Uncharacterized protein n=1 Tax=Phaeosphaeria nodorum (strain SN15 / ATCC MYA-4574 / FGSC 10173) TaxID=321614 RepID=Q0UPB6_PHANO|nr:hypothetical protein SNOG_06398 [Parastagonospora nodorum SN15]EAT86229.1 hypothetical protein SNOG_06398 [Parastagonospora nodorum SN15]